MNNALNGRPRILVFAFPAAERELPEWAATRHLRLPEYAANSGYAERVF